MTDVHFYTLLKCHGPCQRTREGQERVIEPWLSSSALYRGRYVSRRHVAATPNNGVTKRINDGKESCLTSALICRKSEQSGLRVSSRMHFSKRKYIDMYVLRYVNYFTEKTERIQNYLYYMVSVINN